MGRYVFLRVMSIIPVLIGISLIAFVLGTLSPGDPAELSLSRGGYFDPTPEQIEHVRKTLGLDRPLYIQYMLWFIRVLRGDLGTSYMTNRPVSDELVRRLPVTLKLSAYAITLTTVFGITFGLVSVAWNGRLIDRALRGTTNLTLSFPGFWLGLLLIFIFSENLRILPTSGTGTFRHMVLPSITLSCVTTAITIRLARSSLLNEMGKHYILAARARGIGKARLLLWNALPNAVIPIVTLLGNYLGGILGGSVVVETIFALPGIGSFAVEAVHARDYPSLQGYVLLTGLVFVLVILSVDLICVAFNPKIRLGGKISEK